MFANKRNNKHMIRLQHRIARYIQKIRKFIEIYRELDKRFSI